ncbi:hypothetical protein OAS39_11245, partial [Pirellulales bacterium]|nr:hypothetical protein [Pirellulales bacterium]
MDWKSFRLRAAAYCAAVALTLISLSSHSRAAIIDATWIGPAGGSYGDPANWDIGVVPINNAVDQYNVIVGNSASVNFDVAGSSEVLELILGSGATLNIASNRELRTIAGTRISGNLNVTGGLLETADGNSQFLGSGFTIRSSAGGTIFVGAENYTNNLSDHRADLTLLSSDGVGSVLDLSGVNTFTSSSWGYRNSTVGWNYNVSATNNGVIDLSGATTFNGSNPSVNSDNRY